VNICELTVKNYRKYRLTDYLRYLVRAAPTLVSSHDLGAYATTSYFLTAPYQYSFNAS
jgi:hypothetical protein